MSLHALPLPIVDVEASGLHFYSYPVEIAVLVDGTVVSWLIAPERDWTYWDPVAEEMHGISRTLLRNQGLTAHRVARELSAVANKVGGVLYSDAAPWDLDWIRTLYAAAGTSLEFEVRSIHQLLSAAQQQVFQAIRRELENSGRYRLHRAGPDVELIAEAYRRAVVD